MLNEELRARYDRLDAEVQALERRIRTLKDKRDRLSSERARIRRRLYERVDGPVNHTGADQYYIRNDELRPLILSHLDAVGRGAQRQLAIRAGCTQRLIRRIRRPGEGDYTTLRVADKILMALGQPHLSTQLDWWKRTGMNAGKVVWKKVPRG